MSRQGKLFRDEYVVVMTNVVIFMRRWKDIIFCHRPEDYSGDEMWETACADRNYIWSELIWFEGTDKILKFSLDPSDLTYITAQPKCAGIDIEDGNYAAECITKMGLIHEKILALNFGEFRKKYSISWADSGALAAAWDWARIRVQEWLNEHRPTDVPRGEIEQREYAKKALAELKRLADPPESTDPRIGRDPRYH
jgi:hypothetical protein